MTPFSTLLLQDLDYLCSLAFEPRTLLQLSRGRVRRSLRSLRAQVMRSLPIPSELQDYLLCKDL